jgi:hypothetical protein
MSQWNFLISLIVLLFLFVSGTILLEKLIGKERFEKLEILIFGILIGKYLI